MYNLKSSEKNVESLPSTSFEMIKRKPKRRKPKPIKSKSSISQSSILQDSDLIRRIEHLQDDIVTISSITPQKCPAEELNISQQSNGIYLEVPGGFKEIRKNDLYAKTDVCEPYTHEKTRMKSHLSILIQRLSHRVTGLAHGLIAGISLWECLTVYFLRSPNFTHTDFSFHFSSISSASQIFFFALLVVCLIDTLDRSDIIRVNSNIIRHFFFIGSLSVVIILYFISLFLTLYISDIETKYSEYLTPNITNSSEWQVTLSEHNKWWNIVIIRCIVLCTSWIILNLWPSDSRLVLHLEEIKEEEIIKETTQFSMAL